MPQLYYTPCPIPARHCRAGFLCIYAPAHVRMPAERAYLFPRLRASQSAISHRDCPHCRGNGDRQAVSGSRAGSIHLPGLLAGVATHATGTAHPRQTTLATMAQSRTESVVGSMASARPLDFHSDKTHRMSGAKAAITEFRRPLWAVTLPNAGGRVLWTAPPRGSAWSVAASGESGNIRMGSARRTSGGFAFFLASKMQVKPCAVRQAPGRTVDESRSSPPSLLSENRAWAIFLVVAASRLYLPDCFHAVVSDCGEGVPAVYQDVLLGA